VAHGSAIRLVFARRRHAMLFWLMVGFMGVVLVTGLLEGDW
jgi:hypothetical protein